MQAARGTVLEIQTLPPVYKAPSGPQARCQHACEPGRVDRTLDLGSVRWIMVALWADLRCSSSFGEAGNVWVTVLFLSTCL